MPSLLATVQIHRRTPMPAVFFVAMASLVYLLFTDLYALMNYMGFVQTLAIMISVGILIYFRLKKVKPGETPMKASIQVPLVIPIIYLLGSAFLIIFAFVGSPSESLMGCFIILTGIPVYWIFISWKNKPKSIQSKIDWLTVTLQKILLVLPTDKGS
jgi:solute carrier family 7 (L-type amino acid transporter), member 8